MRALIPLLAAAMIHAQIPQPLYVAVPLTADAVTARGYLISCPESWAPQHLAIGAIVTLACAAGQFSVTALADPEAPYGAEIFPAGTTALPPAMPAAPAPGTPEVTAQ